MTATTVEAEIRTRIEGFVDELAKLVRASAVEAVEQALTGGRKPRQLYGSLGHGKTSAQPKKNRRRTRSQLNRTAELLKKHIGEHPGQRMEEIGEAVKKETRELRRPLNRLLAKQEIVRLGHKRASRYYLPSAAPRKRRAKR